MQLQYRELENNIRLIKLIGKLDIIGTGEIETKFAGHCAGSNVRVFCAFRHCLNFWIRILPRDC